MFSKKYIQLKLFFPHTFFLFILDFIKDIILLMRGSPLYLLVFVSESHLCVRVVDSGELETFK